MLSERGDTPLLRVSLLGGFSVERVGAPRAAPGWQRRSAKTLTKVLATFPRHALHREQILEILWPSANLESALNSFGKALHAARHALEPELPRRGDSTYIRLTDAMVILDPKHVVVDADEFERLADEAMRRHEITAYDSALAAYNGELLPEDRYEGWCAERRSLLSELHVRLLIGQAELLDRRGAYNQAADRLREVLAEDQTREDVHRRLMSTYVKMGTPDQAVRQFDLCVEALRLELELAPERETVSLYHDILASRTRCGSARKQVKGPLPAVAEPAADRPFVGRELVIQQLCQHLTRDRGGGAGMIVVSGEAGVGKTRLLHEFAARAGMLGADVLPGGSGAYAHQFTCGPFAVALEAYAGSRPESERRQLADRYPPLACFVPSLGTESAAAGPPDFQLYLIPAIVRFITDLASKRPVLLILGDLEKSDRLSLDLLSYLAQLGVQRRWLMIGAVRDEELEARTELGPMIATMLQDRLCLQIGLQCLPRGECDHLVRASLPGHRVGDHVVEQIYQRSRGNPLLVGELVMDLRTRTEFGAATGEGHRSATTARVPPRLRALTALRLAAMDETLRRVLALAAAADASEVSLSSLRTGAAALQPPLSDAALFDALDSALHMGLLEERDDGYAFRHPLVRSALYENLALHRREQLHAALGAGQSHPVATGRLRLP